MPKKPRICFVVTTLDFGGAEVQVVDLAACLLQRQWDVMIISLMSSTALAKRAAAAGIKIASLDIRNKAPDPRILVRLHRIFSKWKPDLIHSHMFHANMLVRFYRLLNRSVPLISTIHNIYEGKSLQQSNRRCLAYRMTDPLSDWTTIISRVAYHRYSMKKAAPRNKFLHIPNGVNTDKFCPDATAVHQSGVANIKPEYFIWLAIGSVEKQKDYPTLIQSFKEVLRERPDARLWIVGVGSLLENMKNLCCRESLDQKVFWLGRRRRDEILDLMRSADAYVMASEWEGLPMVLLEAAASGLPIVATDVGGNKEVVSQNKTGWVVTASRPDLLAGAMLQLMGLPARKKKQMGMAGRVHVVRNFDVNRIVIAWEKLYMQCLKNSSRRFRTRRTRFS